MLQQFYPDHEADSAYGIDYKTLYRKGYRGIIFDIDNTLVPHGAPATPQAIEFFGRLRELGFQTLLLSNNKEPRVKSFADAVGASYIYKAGKPGRDGYLRAMEQMHTTKETTLFVGDQIFVRRPMQLDGLVVYAHQHHPNELLQAYLAIGLKQIMQEPPVQTRLQTVVNRNVVSVTSKVVYILRHLRQTEHVYLDAVYLDVRERSARVAVFLAVLELTRTGTICISEDNTYIYLRPKEEKE